MTESDTSLRDRLVDAGVELLAAEGLQALTLREIARRTGVSHGAPRRYFPTHLELLSAIARRGFADLAERARQALDRETGGARARVAALAGAYLEFALEQPGMYELMFRHDLLESGRLGLRETSLPLFSLLTGLIAAADPGADAPRVAGVLWANLHGLAQLWRWRSLQLATGEEDLAALLETVLVAHLGPGGGR
ncbi:MULTISPECIES: TetR/AcrR family transcriptional regulator [Streptomyces]|uniref:TetR/AcrR family transcriptional regulator n=1 Tax=Streptomyces TaxID=1883 RepID=UPI00167A3581|nr:MULTISPECIES: TetR/AcrR family transcriptional regulator [Streptomyces]MBK3526083.1 TetR/AcrR family transcriptional regulator [Streptomyces sp. MBT70]GGS05731.1 TetR family transcriptional regulator [Streptomyces eurythermus]